jgi:hypothetical protein
MAPSERSMSKIKLEIRFPDRTEYREFEQAKIAIGREAGEIVLGDPQCSSRHAELHISSVGVMLTDLGSTNGTLLDGERVRNPTQIQVGSEFKIGACTLSVTSFEGAKSGVPQYGPKGTLMVSAVAAGAGASGIPAPGSGVAEAGSGAGQEPPPPHQTPRGTPSPLDIPPPNVPPPSVPPPSPPGVPPPNVPFPSNPPPSSSQFPPLALKISSAPAAQDPDRDPIALLKSCIQEFRPHLGEAFKSVALYAFPLELLGALLGYIPLVGAVLSGVVTLLFVLVHIGFGIGVQGEFALRLVGGTPATASEVWKIQMDRLVPFTLGLLVPLLLTYVGLACCLVPGVLIGLFVLPVYMVEELKMEQVNKRSFELLTKNWSLSLIPLVLVVLPFALAMGVLSGIFNLIPYAGPVLVALVAAAGASLMGPLLTYVSFRCYIAIRKAEEGSAPMDQLRSRL